jgi:peptidoglycan/LPS O-acetylase OafA/YrhL
VSAETTTKAGYRPILSLRNLAAGVWPVSGAIREIAALDGLRAVAVLLVMGFHWLTALNESPRTAPATLVLLHQTGNVWVLGSTGVHLFFVLSGFLLFLPYARALLGGQEFPDTRKFYTRRALRILPAYWFSLVLIVLVFQPQYLRLSGWGDLALHAVLLQNVTATTRTGINPPFWTMAVESQFYLLLPFLAWLLIRPGHARRRAWTAGVFLTMAGASLGFNVLLTAVKHWVPSGLEYIDTLQVAEYLGVFGAGMVAGLTYVAATETSHAYVSAVVIRRLARLAGAAGLILILADILLRIDAVHFTKVEWLCYNLLFGVAYAGILVGTLLGWDRWAWLLSRPALRFLGFISYSLYIWHEQFYRHIIVPLASNFTSDVVTLLLSLGLTAVLLMPFCWGFYHLVERPFIKARRAHH